MNYTEEQEEYLSEQHKWIIANDLKIGDKVRVIRKAENHEAGWDNSWVPSMDFFIGLEECRIDSYGYEGTGDDAMIVSSVKGIPVSEKFECWLFPYYVLEKIAE